LTAISCACRFAHGEITDDWPQIATDELESESDGIAHLDAFGFRYYIPALMLSVLSHYESSSTRVVGAKNSNVQMSGNAIAHASSAQFV
jgi:hypothetical protein